MDVRWTFFAFISIVIGTFTTAYAQSAQTDPSAILNLRGSIADEVATPTAAPKNKLSPIDANATKQRLKLRSVTIHGTHLYPATSFSDLYKKLLGTTVSAADVMNIARQITQHYQDNGYVLALATVKKPLRRDAIIQVSEGYVDNVQLEGGIPSGRTKQLIQAYVDKIKAANPLSVDVLERYLLLINDLPGVNARAVVRQGKVDHGSTMILSFEQKSIDALLSNDNRGSPFIGRWQHLLSAGFNDVFDTSERTLIRLITASPNRELRYVDVTQEHTLSSEGTMLRIGGSYVKTVPGEDLDDTAFLRGESATLSAMLMHPFVRAREQNLYGRVELDMRDSTNDRDFSVTQNADRVRSLRISGLYNVIDNTKAINSLDAQLSQGIAGLGATPEHGLLRSRRTGEQDYTKWNINLSRAQPITNYFSLFMSTSGQYAHDPLLISEQFFIGGTGYGRGYDPAELNGDHGISGKLELRYTENLQYPWLQRYQLYGFYDAGKVWRKAPLASETSNASLASAGLGIQATLTENVSGNLEAAVPLTKDVTNTGDTRERIYGGFTIRY